MTDRPNSAYTLRGCLIALPVSVAMWVLIIWAIIKLAPQIARLF